LNVPLERRLAHADCGGGLFDSEAEARRWRCSGIDLHMASESNKEAFRYLKRHLVRVVWRALREPAEVAPV
jgi:hypothetical protein